MEVSSFTQKFEKNIDTGAKAVKSVMTIQLAINAIFSGMLGKLVIFVSALQIILMLPMQRVGLPAMVASFLKITISIAEFDVIDPEWTVDKFLEYDENLTDDQ